MRVPPAVGPDTAAPPSAQRLEGETRRIRRLRRVPRIAAPVPPPPHGRNRAAIRWTRRAAGIRPVSPSRPCADGGAAFAAFRLQGAAERAVPLLIWAHGWGHTHQALLPLAQAMRSAADSWLVDLPGFGASPLPPGPWGTENYADAMAEWLPTLEA